MVWSRHQCGGQTGKNRAPVVPDLLLEGFRPPAPEHGVWGSWPSRLDPKGGEVLLTPGGCRLAGVDVVEDVTSHIAERAAQDPGEKRPLHSYLCCV